MRIWLDNNKFSAITNRFQKLSVDTMQENDLKTSDQSLIETVCAYLPIPHELDLLPSPRVGTEFAR
jgi:hypothetical protein